MRLYHRLYLYGGNELKSETFSDLWAINLSSVEEHINGKSTKDIEWFQISSKGDNPGKVSHHGCVLYKNEMIIYGGLHNYANTDKSLYSLNLETLEWKIKGQKGVKPVSRDEHSVVLYNSSIYIFGGSLSKGPLSNDLWVYSVETEEWKKLEITGAKPSPRSGHAACILDSKMYVFGGISEENIRLNDLWVCNLDSSQWEEIKCEKPPKVIM
jgi:Rab9 effector protein with kelch motifs